MQTVSLFNPFSSKFHALDNFKSLSLGQKIITVIATLAISTFTLMIGTAPTFRLLVGRFRKVDLNNKSHPKKLGVSARKAHDSGLSILNTKPVKTTSFVINEELKNNVTYQMTEGEKWLYSALGLPLGKHDILEIRKNTTLRIKTLYTGNDKPYATTREVIQKKLKMIAIEERLLSLAGNTSEQAEVITWANTNHSSIHGLLDCFSILYKKTEDLFESKKQELALLMNDAAKAHPSLEQYFHEIIKKTIKELITSKTSKYLAINSNKVNSLTSYNDKKTQQQLFDLFDQTERKEIEQLANSLTLDLVLQKTPFPWYEKWKNKIIASLVQSNNIGEQALGFGVCEGLTLRLIRQELEDPDRLMNNLDSLLQITPIDKFLQNKTLMFKKTENSDYTQEFLKGIGLNKPSIDFPGFYNEICFRLRKHYKNHYKNLIKHCWLPNHLNSGVCRLAIYFSDEQVGHALYVRHEKKTNTFRLFDANIGLIQLDTAKEFYECLGELIQSFYPELKSFAFTRFELAS